MSKLKATILGAFVLVPLAMMSGCTGDSNTATTGNDSVQGVVIDTVTGQPVVGATVKSGWATSTTDKSGVYNLGTAPYTINAGNIAMPDAAYVVAIDTTTSTGAAAAGYGSTYFRRVTVGQTVNSDANILRIGKLNTTVKGLVLTSNGTPVMNNNQLTSAGATVTLTYFANTGNASIGTGTNVNPVLTASSLSTTADASGAYSITKVEAGSSFQLTARSADGKYTQIATQYSGTGLVGNTTINLPPIDNFTYGGNNGNNVTNITFNAAPDNYQPLRTLNATITVGTAAAVQANSGDFAAGATTITFNFNRAVAKTTYTDTAGVYQASGAPVLNSLMNDVVITQTAKASALPFTATWSADMKSLAIAFTTSPSMIYGVNINAVTAKLFDTNGVAYNAQTTTGPAEVVAANSIAFSTSGSPAVGTIPASPISRTTGTTAGDTTITIAPVTNMAGYYLYVSRYVNDVLTVNYTAYNTAGAKRVLTNSTVNLNANSGAGGVDFDSTVVASAFAALGTTGATGFYNGINKISYKVKVVYLNADRIELPANTTAEFLVDDKTKVQVTSVTSAASFAIPVLGDLSIGAYPAVTVNNALSTAAAVNGTQGRAKTINSGTVNNKFIFGDIRTIDSSSAGGTAAIPAAFTGDFYAIDVADVTNTKATSFVAKIVFNDQMIATQVQDATKWGIIDTASPTAAAAAPLAQVIALRTNNAATASNCENVSLDAGNVAGTAKCYAGVTLNAPTVVYDSNTLTATITYGLKWGFTQPVTGVAATQENLVTANPAGTGTVYRINVPDFRFTFAGTDLNGNGMNYGAANKGF